MKAGRQGGETRARLVDRTWQESGVDWRAQQQLQGVEILRDSGPHCRDIGLGRRQDDLGLSQVGPRRDAALQPGLGQLNAALGIGVDDRTGEACMQLRVGLAGVELAQHNLAVRPGQIEDAIGKTAILVFIDQ